MKKQNDLHPAIFILAAAVILFLASKLEQL